jgi:Zn-dependent metalloprotease
MSKQKKILLIAFIILPLLGYFYHSILSATESSKTGSPILAPGSPPKSAVIDSTDAQRTTMHRIRERFGGAQANVTRDGKITLINWLDLGMLTPENAVERIYQFFEQNTDLFNLANPRQELIVSKSYIPSQGHGVVAFQQVINGIEVQYGGFDFNLGENNEFISRMRAYYYPEARNVNTTPSIDSLQAFLIALSDPVNDTLPAVAHQATLFIANFNGDLHLVWNFFVSGGGYGGSAEYYIDAQSGAILKARTALI